MTIHDIIVNCGSLLADTSIIILDDYGEVKWQDIFKNLPLDYENLKIKFFIVGILYERIPKIYFRFYV